MLLHNFCPVEFIDYFRQYSRGKEKDPFVNSVKPWGFDVYRRATRE